MSTTQNTAILHFGKMHRTLKERLEDMSIPVPWTGCWIWLGAVNNCGYAFMKVKTPTRRMTYAHIISYEISNGAIPPGFTIDHVCKEKLCVNPAHLEAVTYQENILRGNNPPAINARKAFCKNGHPFTLENTALRSRPGGGRTCRICKKLRDKRSR